MPINSQYKTNLSSNLQEIFSNSTKPLFVVDIVSLLTIKNHKYNKTSIYRQLEKMIKSNKISQINTVHGTAWESQKSLNHAHLVCDSCEEISCVTIPQEFLITIIQKISNFNIHKLTINGVCNHCSLN